MSLKLSRALAFGSIFPVHRDDYFSRGDQVFRIQLVDFILLNTLKILFVRRAGTVNYERDDKSVFMKKI